MKVLVSKGQQNIRLGNFIDANGEPFNSSFPTSVDYLTADVVSGATWSDFPGNNSGVSLVVSDRAKTVLQRAKGCEAFAFVRTVVSQFPKDSFWALSDTLNVWVEALEDSDELASRTFQLRPSFSMEGRQFVIDESMYPVLSDELSEKLKSEGLVGFDCVSCDQLR